MKFSPRKVHKITDCIFLSIGTFAWICAVIAGIFVCQKYINSIILSQKHAKINSSA